MLLVIDVGNTNMTLGVYEGEQLAATFRMMAETPRTSDEYGVMITQLLKNRGIDVKELEGTIVASVVPEVMHSLMGGLVRYTETRPIVVQARNRRRVSGLLPRMSGQSVQTGLWTR